MQLLFERRRPVIVEWHHVVLPVHVIWRLKVECVQFLLFQGLRLHFYDLPSLLLLLHHYSILIKEPQQILAHESPGRGRNLALLHRLCSLGFLTSVRHRLLDVLLQVPQSVSRVVQPGTNVLVVQADFLGTRRDVDVQNQVDHLLPLLLPWARRRGPLLALHDSVWRRQQVAHVLHGLVHLKLRHLLQIESSAPRGQRGQRGSLLDWCERISAAFPHRSRRIKRLFRPKLLWLDVEGKVVHLVAKLLIRVHHIHIHAAHAVRGPLERQAPSKPVLASKARSSQPLRSSDAAGEGNRRAWE
mmetsp:Transcript_14571/g.28175  ORF Transcript_14571/g.28175 Transcript_14571/m.28175 type:complete len:300 (+) Transcript_14571:1435-2334(+)